MSDGASKPSMRHLSMLGAWALAFGCAVGSDAFVMPWSEFLPKAGPLGTVLGILVGGLIMTVVAWNFHYMINRMPGPGGAYAYASKAFGHDHGFLCGFLLGFAYLAIVWLDVTALVVVAHYTLGDTFSFGFRYTIQKSDIYFGDILLSVSAIAAASAICCRRRLSGAVQSALAVIRAAGILLCFAAAALNHDGGLGTIRPFFAPDRGNGLFQTLNILAIAPWLFVGFEAISNSSAEFRFPARKAFGVMLATLATAVVAYAFLTSCLPRSPRPWSPTPFLRPFRCSRSATPLPRAGPAPWPAWPARGASRTSTHSTWPAATSARRACSSSA